MNICPMKYINSKGKLECEFCANRKECDAYNQSHDRAAYQKDYYQRHKAEIQSKYASKSKFLRYVTVRATIRKLSKQIGSANVAIVLNAIEQIEKE